MCGIILSVGDHSPDDIDRALAAMSYRGAEPFEAHSRIVEGGAFTLGHVRLPLQTPASTGERFSEGEQPIMLPARSVGATPGMIAFTGEFFGVGNEEAWLRDLVDEPGTQALEEALHKVDGFWNLLYYPGNGSMFMYTDHLGIKPLYIWASEGLICSEIEPMIAAANKRPEPDPIYLANVVKWGYDHSGRTPWKGITQVPPGHKVNISFLTRDMYCEPYWDWAKVENTDRKDFPDLFLEAVRNRVLGVDDRSNNLSPALLLSGGLDSTLIYQAIKNQGLLDYVKILHFENGESNYLPEDTEIEIIELEETPKLGQALCAMQAPLDLGSLLPQEAMARRLRELGVTMVLTGDGADELFGGYRRAQLYDSQMSDIFCELPYYHLPRLDRVHMRYTQEVRSPFLAPRMVKRALTLPYDVRTMKQTLHRLALDLGVPSEVVERLKHPLKSKQVLEGGIKHRIELRRLFLHIFQTHPTEFFPS